MTRAAVFHLLAGPNGAGKSTLFNALVRDGIISQDLPFINADLYEKTNLQHIADPIERSQSARRWADGERTRLIHEKSSFVSETVFSHESKLTLLHQAIAAGLLVVLYVVAVDDPQVLLARVQQRVKEGGHHVPAERVLARYPRTLGNLKAAIPIATVSYLYDSFASDSLRPALELIAIVRPAHRPHAVRILSATPPPWASTMLASL